MAGYCGWSRRGSRKVFSETDKKDEQEVLESVRVDKEVLIKFPRLYKRFLRGLAGLD